MQVILGQISTLDEGLAAYARQLGITGVQFNTPELPAADGRWRYEDVAALRDRCAALGLRLEVIENLPYGFYDDVMLGGPRRDEQLAAIADTIRALGRAGVPILGYNFMPTFVWRTDLAAPSRGGAAVTAFDLAQVEAGNRIEMPHASPSQQLSAEALWANHDRFLAELLPVAEEAGVRLALHPDDPPVAAIGGNARIFTSPEALARADAASGGSPAWGVDLCLGTVSAMPGGAAAVERAIDLLGPSGRIAYVHFRDVRGTVPRFEEAFIGDGNFDPAAVMRQLRRVGFDGPLLDDHVPRMIGDSGYLQARAHAIGYLQGLIKAAA
ncbi:mannonate dehydratase [Conexibacter sp. JD483]|uniref:mannonate dehydratase n=1 Tax=unclassified Conexibacter TaxID=2627773 RepID=UPI002715C780|nr:MULTISPECIES: mannonate dehydratase [unclassified Conexibacter]MDO8187576.1 mannonate dehydratase [Conexibacter sp. CPCC 205706]MDO8198942.1 mannonate dehydratase [Conexibacter sp. CPCC 205762]MDR9370351.1 mannonate dehydratase [Conexibacter sp. JD483]